MDDPKESEQREKILQLMDFGNLGRDRSMQLLVECDWNIDRAINKVFGEPEPVQSPA